MADINSINPGKDGYIPTRAEVEHIRNRTRTKVDPDEALRLLARLDEAERLLREIYEAWGVPATWPEIREFIDGENPA